MYLLYSCKTVIHRYEVIQNKTTMCENYVHNNNTNNTPMYVEL